MFASISTLKRAGEFLSITATKYKNNVGINDFFELFHLSWQLLKDPNFEPLRIMQILET